LPLLLLLLPATIVALLPVSRFKCPFKFFAASFTEGAAA